MRKSILLASLCLLFTASAFADTVLTENFNSVAALAGNGWVVVNNSSPTGSTDWFQGNSAVFDAQSGPADSYVAANFNAADFAGNISDWLITPEISLSNSLIVTFFTRTEPGAFPGDSLEVRLSTNGASTDVGSSDSSVGDFTTLLLAVNPSGLGDYPSDWTAYTITLDPLGAGAQGRIAFRYAVSDTSQNGDYIGLDSLTVATPEPASLTMLGLGLAALALRNRKRSI